MAHVTEEKKKVIQDLTGFMKEYPIVGVVDMENLPAQQLQKMRAKLRDRDVRIRMAKKRLMRIAFDEAKKDNPGIEELADHFKGMPALIFTKNNPFTLFKTLEKNKSEAPAKAGQEAPKDVVVKAGPTPFQPGPIIGELGGLGIKTQIQDGKIHITSDAVVVKEGEEINAETAGLLSRLGIKPMEVGLDLVATYEDGNIFTKKILAIDEDEYKGNISQAHQWAFNLGIEAGVFTEETTEFMLIKAFTDAKGLALGEDILTDLTAQDILAKAERQMMSLHSQVDLEAPAEAPAEEKKKEEESSEEAPAEEESKDESSEESASEGDDSKKETSSEEEEKQ